MPLLLGCLALGFPRLVILLVVIFSDYIGRAYQNDVWAFLGFFFAPLTTLCYAWIINSHGSVDGLYIVALIIAVMLDLGLLGGGGRATKKRVVVYREGREVKRVENTAR